jgi:hypothetical protein
MDVSLMTIASSLEDFRVIIKVLFQSMQISMPSRSKGFITLGISIAAMAMASLNA